MLNDILWPDHIQWQPPTDQTLYRIQSRPFTEFWEISIEHLRWVWHADRGRLLLRTTGPVPFWLAYVLLVETNPFSELVVIFTDYALRISLGTFQVHGIVYHSSCSHASMIWAIKITPKRELYTCAKNCYFGIRRAYVLELTLITIRSKQKRYFFAEDKTETLS